MRRVTASATVTPDESVPSQIKFNASGTIGGTTGVADNALLRADGTGGGTAQGSNVLVDDSGNIAAAINCRTVAAVNFNAASSDTQLPIVLPAGYTRYRINQIIISGASASINAATWGLFTAAAGGGVAISAAGQATGMTTAAENTASNMLVAAPASINQNTQSFNAANLFFRVGAAQGSAATATVTVTYTPVS